MQVPMTAFHVKAVMGWGIMRLSVLPQFSP